MRPYILAENNWKSLKDERFEVAILPWGATEAHNFHLPYGTDNYEADTLAGEAAGYAWERGARAVVLPTIPYGVNTGQADIYLDMNLNPSTQLAILDDITATLDRQGLRKLIVFNSHGGNNFKPLLRELGLRYPHMLICMTNWFQALNRDNFVRAKGDHADAVETSLMLSIRPELVLGREDWGKGTSFPLKIGAFSSGWAWMERKWSQATVDTGVGDPSEATAATGDAIRKALQEQLGEFILEFSKADPDDLYAR